MHRFFVRIILVALPVAGAAQVGHPPDRSPYRDLERKSEFTYLAGYYESAIDPARVAPRDGPLVGIHYERRVTGPGYLTARLVGVQTDRQVVNPSLAIGERSQGDIPSPFLLLDVGASVNVTGFKSWHGLVPTLGGGAGVGFGMDGPRDVAKYHFGVPFVLSVRPGLKFLPNRRWSGRLDATNYFYRVRYPETFYTKTGPDDTVLPVDAARNFWKRNRAVTLGLTWSFGR